MFPLGMFSSAAYALAADLKLPAIKVVARVFLWIAVAVWLLVAAGQLRRSASRAFCHEADA